jgi:hypothetical protein
MPIDRYFADNILPECVDINTYKYIYIYIERERESTEHTNKCFHTVMVFLSGLAWKHFKAIGQRRDPCYVTFWQDFLFTKHILLASGDGMDAMWVPVWSNTTTSCASRLTT